LSPEPPPAELVRAAVCSALAEDRAHEDASTAATIPLELRGSAMFWAKEPCVVSGLGVASSVFAELDSSLVFKRYAVDGGRTGRDQPLASVSGRIAPILSAERAALNFLQRLSGVATLTRSVVDAVEGTGVTILDTRKTTPGLRALEKYAVRCGGGQNHRMDLAGAILLKDNHLAAAAARGLSLADLVSRALAGSNGLPVEVEVSRVNEAAEALSAGAQRLLLDNMSTSEMVTVVDMARGKAQTEASGGITLENVRQVAETGVDFISMGALTHSAPAVDLSLEVLSG
jgi:nicotinate-nucleotide pyrophosphorylase (carboxylating)